MTSPVHYADGPRAACNLPVPPVPAGQMTGDPARVTCKRCKGTLLYRDAAPAGAAGPARKWHDDWEVAGRDGDGGLVLRHKPSGGLYRITPSGSLRRIPEEDL